MKKKKKKKTPAEVFSHLRRNFDQDDIRKMTSMEIPSKKDKLKKRNNLKNFEEKFYKDE